MKRFFVLVAALAFSIPLASRAAPTAEVLDVRKIWDEGAHNAFTDLIRWDNRWWCTFRESEAHVGGDGAIRILVSTDGAKWESAVRLTEKGTDLRDPKLTVMPSGKLMLNCGGSVYEGRTLKGKQSRVLFSSDGRTWTAPQRILSEGEWLWRVTWHDGIAYGAVYNATTASSAPAGPEWLLSIYRSTDGVSWALLKKMEVAGRPGEMTLGFEPSGEMLALVRREGDDRLGRIGRALPPYQKWTWQTSNYRFGGQNAVRLPSGAWIVGTRDYALSKPRSTDGWRTILAQLEPDGRLAILATLPSGGDTSYPGMVWRDGVMWVSYYSSHEGKSAIYLARVKIAE